MAASARRKPSTTAEVERPSREEPVDLMTAMRERASARGRRGGRRKSAPTQTPVDAAPREDALPLEDIAYDPETMPPPPAARGRTPPTPGPRASATTSCLPLSRLPLSRLPWTRPAEVPAAEAPAADDDRASDRHDSDTHDSDDRDDAGHELDESAPVAGFEDAAEAETSPSMSLLRTRARTGTRPMRPPRMQPGRSPSSRNPRRLVPPVATDDRASRAGTT